MATAIVFNGVSYSVPAYGDSGYAQGPGNLSSYLIALASGTLQTTGGSFPLSADANFGNSFGLVALYYKSVSANIASAGVIRLANSDLIEWRNAANSGNDILGVNGSDQLTYNGSVVQTGTGFVTSITGTANEIIASSATGAVTLSTPQPIASTSSPTFASLTLTTPLALAEGGTGTVSGTGTGSVVLNTSPTLNTPNLGTPSAVTLTNATGLPLTTGVTGVLHVANGGSGASSFTAYSVILAGTTATGAFQNVSGLGLSGQVLTSQGTSAVPIWANAAGTGTVNSGTATQLAYYATSSNAVSGANVYYISGSGFLGIAQTSPAFALDVVGDIQVTTTDENPARGIISYQVTTDQASAHFSGKKSRGTASSPTAVVADDYITCLAANPYDGSSFLLPATACFQVTPGSSVSTGVVPTDFVVRTGSGTPGDGQDYLRVDYQGHTGINQGTNTSNTNATLAVTALASTVAAAFNNNSSTFATLTLNNTASSGIALDIPAGSVVLPSGLATNAAGYILGTVVQTVQFVDTASSSGLGVNTFAITTTTATIVPKASTHKIRITCSGTLQNTSVATSSSVASIFRATTNIDTTSNGFCSISGGSTTNISVPATMTYLDSPATTSSTKYSVYIKNSAAGADVVWNNLGGSAVILLEEIAF